MTNILIPVSNIVSFVLYFCKDTWASSLAALNFSKSLIPTDYLVYMLLRLSHSPKSWTKIKYFLTSLILSAVLPISHLIDLCFFLGSEFMVISPIMLFQTYINIIRRSVWTAISSTLPPVQAQSRIVETTIALSSPVHLTTVWWSSMNFRLLQELLKNISATY